MRQGWRWFGPKSPVALDDIPEMDADADMNLLRFVFRCIVGSQLCLN